MGITGFLWDLYMDIYIYIYPAHPNPGNLPGQSQNIVLWNFVYSNLVFWSETPCFQVIPSKVQNNTTFYPF